MASEYRNDSDFQFLISQNETMEKPIVRLPLAARRINGELEEVGVNMLSLRLLQVPSCWDYRGYDLMIEYCPSCLGVRADNSPVIVHRNPKDFSN